MDWQLKHRRSVILIFSAIMIKTQRVNQTSKFIQCKALFAAFFYNAVLQGFYFAAFVRIHWYHLAFVPAKRLMGFGL